MIRAGRSRLDRAHRLPSRTASCRSCRKLKLQGDLPATTAIDVEEIVRGVGEAEVNVARHLFRGLVIMPIDEDVAWQAGSWRRRFSELGVTLFQADCLIAAAAHRHRGVLCTGHPKDFPMSEVSVQHWPVGA